MMKQEATERVFDDVRLPVEPSAADFTSPPLPPPPPATAPTPLPAPPSPRRFAVLFFFSILTAINAQQWIVYSPIPNASKAAFALTTDEVNILSTIFMIVFVALFFLSSSVIEQWSLRTSLLIGGLLTSIGAVMKLAIAVPVPDFLALWTSQTIIAIGQVFLLSAPPVVASEWFPSNERAGATAIGSMANNLGTAIGMLITPLMVWQEEKAVSSDFVGIFSLQVGLSILPTVGIWLVMRRRLLSDLPHAPPLTTAPGGIDISSAMATTERIRTKKAEDDQATTKTTAVASSAVSLSSFTIPQPSHAVSGNPGRGGGNDEDDVDDNDLAVSSEIASGCNNNNRTTTTTVVNEKTPLTRPPSLFPHPSSSQEQTSCSNNKCTAPPDTTATSSSSSSFASIGRVIVTSIRDVMHTSLILARHRDFMFLFLSFSISIGSIWTMSTLLAQIVDAFFISNATAGLMGSMNLIFGAVVAYAVGRWVDVHRQYKVPLLLANLLNCVCLSSVCIWLSFGFPSQPETGAMTSRPPAGSASSSSASAASASASAPVASTGATWGVFVLYVLAGAAQNTVIPVCFEFAMEVTYPLSDSVPGALLMAGGNVVSLVLVSVGSAILGPDLIASQTAAIKTFAMTLGVGAAGGLFALGARENLGRLEAERSARESHL